MASSAALESAHSYVHVETPKRSTRGGGGGDDTLKQLPASSQSLSVDAPMITLEWEKLSLSVSVKNARTKVLEQKTILHNVNGFARPGELLVIMGPSGAGKSSLLDCISGRNPDVEGTVLVNGDKWSEGVKRFASYVVQDDLFYATITVREHLMFQAKLRMGKTFSKEQYSVRVDEVLEELGLNKCRDTLIGGGMERGISGGERKRLSFASEILTNPSILFVDEPTSGLDSFMAETVVAQLQQIAREGRTVIATIHQPSSDLYALFDQLYLLSDGSPVYHGKASDAVPYFAALGFQCPTFTNPSDYFMRQLVVLDKDSDLAGVQRLTLLKDAWSNSPHLIQDKPSTSQHETSHAMINATEYEDPRVGFCGQLSVIAHRNVLRIVRDDMAFKSEALQAIIIYVFVSLIYLQLDEDQKGIQSFAGAFFYISIDQMFAASYPVFATVPLEIPLVFREYKAGLYNLGAWYLAKNVSEFPQQIIIPLIGFVPAYFMIGIGHGFDVYLKMQLVVMLLHSSSVGIGYWVSCMCRRVEIAPIVGTVLMLPFLLFGGLLVNTKDVPSFLTWLAYLSPIKYGFDALMKIFWSDVAAIPCDEVVCLARSGAEVLRNYSLDDRPLAFDVLCLLALNVGFRVLGYVALVVNLKRDK
ncbi:Atp-binding protein [Globisporangium polare]